MRWEGESTARTDDVRFWAPALAVAIGDGGMDGQPWNATQHRGAVLPRPLNRRCSADGRWKLLLRRHQPAILPAQAVGRRVRDARLAAGLPDRSPLLRLARAERDLCCRELRLLHPHPLSPGLTLNWIFPAQRGSESRRQVTACGIWNHASFWHRLSAACFSFITLGTR